MLEDKNERRASAEAKKHIAWYIKGINGAASARAAVMNAQNSEEIFEILTELQKSL